VRPTAVSKQVLLLDPRGLLNGAIQKRCDGIAGTLHHSDFKSARQSLLEHRPAILVTDLRLGAYNGLHLACVANTTRIGTRTIVFGDPMDPVLAREAQRIGAFVESLERLPFSIASYLTKDLPPVDRRNPGFFDRRCQFRGGRRASDVADLQLPSNARRKALLEWRRPS
jgi:hypothetical protein